jgi:hypothetical protein
LGGEAGDDGIAIDRRVDAHHEGLPGRSHPGRNALRLDALDTLEPGQHACGQPLSSREDVVELRHLHVAQRCVDIAHPHVEPRLDEARASIRVLGAVVAQTPHRGRDGVVVRQHHAALAGGHDLARMEAEARRVAHGTGAPVADGRSDRARGVGKQGDAGVVGQALESDVVGGQSERIDRDDHLRPRRPRSLDRVDVDRERVPADVHQAQIRAARQHGVSGGRVGEVGDDHLIARTNAERADGELQGGRSRRHGDRVRNPDVAGDAVLEVRHARPHCQVAALQHALDRLDRLGPQARVG